MTQNRAGLQFKCVLTDIPPSPRKVGHTTEIYVPDSFRTVVWVLLRSTMQEPDNGKCCETGPTVFRPYPRRLERLIVLLSYLKTLSVGPAGV